MRRATLAMRRRLSLDPDTHFGPSLTVIALIGLGACLAYAIGVSPHEPLAGDALVYHYVASALVHGHGFSNGNLSTHGPFRPTAAHPPLFPLVLAGLDELGLTTFDAQRAALCGLGAAGVALVGLVGRRVAGTRAGLLAAAVAAGYPNLFMIDGMVLAEALYVPLIALISLLALRLVERPSMGRSAALGAAIGVATLTRSEAILLVPLLVLPIVWRARRPRGRPLIACTIAVLVVISPWLARNWVVMHRFPLLSTNGALTSAAANCDYAYYHEVGFFSGRCAINTPCARLAEVQEAACLEHLARVYVRHHLRRVPIVVLAREGRMWNVYGQEKDLRYASLGGRNYTVGQVGLGMYFVLLVLAGAGIVSLRHRRRLLISLLAPFALVTIAAATTWGFSRYRVAAEIPLTVLAAVGIQAARARTRQNWLMQSSAAAGLVAVAGVIALTVTPNPRVAPSFALSPGSCTVDGLHVTGPRACRLSGLIGRPSHLTASAIRLANGSALPLVPRSVLSAIDHSQLGHGHLEIAGWAADVQHSRPAGAIVIFLGEKFFGVVKPISTRPDVALAYRNKAVIRSGFEVALPASVVRNGRPVAALRLFAVGASRASPMAFTCSGAQRQIGC